MLKATLPAPARFAGFLLKEEKRIVEVAQGISKRSAGGVSQKEERAAASLAPNPLQRYKQTRKQFPLLLPNTAKPAHGLPAAQVLQIKPN